MGSWEFEILLGPRPAPSTYTVTSGSNRVASISGALPRTYSYDAAGNTTGYAGTSFTYDNRGRMVQADYGGSTATYVYNAIGQRVKRVGPSGTSLYVYDEAGHLLGDYDGAGALVQETVWLGDIPVVTLRPNGPSVAVYYVHTDHLNTPRLVTQPADNAARWRWDSDPFGTNAPNENPSGLGVFKYNLRFPGQQYDGLVGLYYNYFRDYDAATGRYVESDPIGLSSGINTFNYVDSQPLTYLDPFGQYKLKGPQVPDPGIVNPALYIFVNCVQRCYGWPITVTATTNGHTSGAHARSRAVDITVPLGGLSSDEAVCCALGCGARYVQDEYRYPSPNATGPHIHAQLDRGKGGATGTGRYPRPKCNDCATAGPNWRDAL